MEVEEEEEELAAAAAAEEGGEAEDEGGLVLMGNSSSCVGAPLKVGSRSTRCVRGCLVDTPARKRCDGWKGVGVGCWLMMAGALWWSASEGLGLAADCATPINLARGGVFWGAGGGAAFSGQQPNSVCVTVLSTVFCQLCLSVCRSPTKPGRWCEVVQSAAGCCSVSR